MRVRGKLELTVWYRGMESPERARALLKDLVGRAFDEGALSGVDSDAEVETHDVKVFAIELSDA